MFQYVGVIFNHNSIHPSKFVLPGMTSQGKTNSGVPNQRLM